MGGKRKLYFQFFHTEIDLIYLFAGKGKIKNILCNKRKNKIKVLSKVSPDVLRPCDKTVWS